jgi:hypothetical protein
MFSFDISPRAPVIKSEIFKADRECRDRNNIPNRLKEGVNLPSDITVKEIKVPTAPKSVIVMKLRKNCFFFTWNLKKTLNE